MSDANEAYWQSLYLRAPDDPRAWLEWRQHPSTCNTDPLAIRHVSDLLADLAKARSVIERVRGKLPALLDEAWDDGNATGLDGWVGPGRGAGEVDDYAISQRKSSTDRLAARILADAEGSGQ